MSDVECTEDQQPLPKRQKLCSASGEEIAADEEAAAASSAGARAGDIAIKEPPDIMWSSGTCKFLKEADVGITEYISSQPGFFAILKQRSNIDCSL